jgi:hypothetical protein
MKSLPVGENVHSRTDIGNVIFATGYLVSESAYGELNYAKRNRVLRAEHILYYCKVRNSILLLLLLLLLLPVTTAAVCSSSLKNH